METLLKIKDAAKLLNISTSYLYKKAEEGTIGSIKIGSALRFSQKNIAEYLEKCNRNPNGIEPDNKSIAEKGVKNER